MLSFSNFFANIAFALGLYSPISNCNTIQFFSRKLLVIANFFVSLQSILPLRHFYSRINNSLHTENERNIRIKRRSSRPYHREHLPRGLRR